MVPRAIPVSFALFFLACGVQSPPPPQTVGTPGPLEGAWRLVDMRLVDAEGRAASLPPRESFFLFAGSRYSMTFAFGDGSSPPYAERWKPSDEEKLARFASMLVNAGTFEIQGDRMLARPFFAVAPEFVGGEGRFRFGFVGDTLDLTWEESIAWDGLPYPGGGVVTLLRLVRLP